MQFFFVVNRCSHKFFLCNPPQVLLQLGAAPIPPEVPVPSVNDLADQVADVLDYFG